MAKRSRSSSPAAEVATVDRPTGTATCPHCGTVVDLEACPTFNGQGVNGLFCSGCRGPLTEESVSDNVSFGCGKEGNALVREALKEKIREAIG